MINYLKIIIIIFLFYIANFITNTTELTDFNCNDINTDVDNDIDNDSNYEPSSNSSITSDNTEIESDKQNESDNNKSAAINSIDVSAISVRACNDESMYVSVSKPKGAQKKIFCYFCKKFQSKIARHLETVHRNEEEVKKFTVMPKG